MSAIAWRGLAYSELSPGRFRSSTTLSLVFEEQNLMASHRCHFHRREYLGTRL